jgi:transposase-like protein
MRPEIMAKKQRGKHRKFKAEYKAEVVRLCQQPGKTPPGVAQELGLTASALMNWGARRQSTRAVAARAR